MKYVLATCTYCDYKWRLFNEFDLACYKCGDRKPKIEEKDTRSNIDYYAGSPPFPSGIYDASNTRDGIKQSRYWDSGQSTKTSTLKES